MTPEQREELKAAAERILDDGWYEERDKGMALDACDSDCDFIFKAKPSAILSLIAQVEALTVDADRWQFLVSIMESAKGGAHLTVNQHLAYYEECEPGEEVSLQWYPDTPIGSYNVEGSSITQVVDEARSEFAAPTIPAIPGTKDGA